MILFPGDPTLSSDQQMPAFLVPLAASCRRRVHQESNGSARGSRLSAALAYSGAGATRHASALCLAYGGEQICAPSLVPPKLCHPFTC